MSELQRYQFDEDGFEKTSDADEGDFIEFVKVADMKATVQPLVDALEGLLPLFDFLHIEMYGTCDPAQEWDEYEQARFDAQKALAAYRKAMGVEG